MSYTMLNNEAIRKYDYATESLEGAALSFIRDLCEGLRFDKNKATSFTENNLDFDGTSLKSNQIPYNMEKDIDRLCLENAVNRFLKSGKKEDAFDVYFCYLEMFVGDYLKTRRMIELLSEYEANGSGLLMKHRDHYSHSVYVFILGLAIYQSNEIYRRAYKDYYKISDDKEAAAHYIEFWGLSSLFHDIGYPFELPFEQVCSYFEVEGDDRSRRPFVTYKGLDSFKSFDKWMQRKIGLLYDLDENNGIYNTDELFAYDLSRKLGGKYYFSENEMLEYLKNKPTEPDKFGYYMDHAYFSATVLFKKLFCELKVELKREHVDALSAIILHNSLYKFCVAYYKDPQSNIPFDVNLHPLAYMLMLCDELQCWDRTAYGRNSKHELHPMSAEFIFSDNKIEVTYIFDKEEQEKIDSYIEDYDRWIKDGRGKCPKLKAFSSMYQMEHVIRTDGSEEDVCSFQADIEKIVDLTEIELEVSREIDEVSEERKSKELLSESNFISLYNFGAALNARWSNEKKSDKEMYEDFREMSLEYKLSNINQAKAFSKYLDKIHAFYTYRNVGFEMLRKFNEDELALIGPLEHERWLNEHYRMGWGYISKDEIEEMVRKETGLEDTESEDFKDAIKKKRELIRKHWDIIPGYTYSGADVPEEKVLENYNRIGQGEQDKDTMPMIHMIELLKQFDGLRIYRLN